MMKETSVLIYSTVNRSIVDLDSALAEEQEGL
jgi:hypothetical protein